MENKLGLTEAVELARAEEKLSKAKAARLFEQGLLDTLPAGTFAGLAAIHRFLFEEIYPFAGQIRHVTISRGQCRFASVLYLEDALRRIDQMPQGSFEEIVEKYVEMNVAHPFREVNGRSARIWLDAMLKKGLGVVVDWSGIDREAYWQAMERSPVNDAEIKELLKKGLTAHVDDRLLYMKGIDASYHYEGYHIFRTEDLIRN